ncbi:MAG TPA: tetratricopeptide repeat protein [Kofleriaceae bacterium]|nr:tetratricopeptide repeat protein [Kofleriaceae bacterium]
MADDRRPSEEEIEELIGLTRRDPGSPAFVDLGDAYLALGRPRDAVEVGLAGLSAAPDNLEGRVMIARAHAQLHQWKEAQAELLKVVKVDRAHKLGFSLLGEVLLRRSDYERAIPVLQHAQNLDPSSPAVLALLKRARAGQPLDPPAPIPSPISAKRGGGFGAPGEGAPTKVEPRAAELARKAMPSAPALPRSKGPTRPPPAAPKAPPVYDDGPTSVAPPRAAAALSIGDSTGQATVVRGDPTEVSPPRSFYDDDEATAGRGAKPRLPLEPSGDSRPVASGSPAPAGGVRPRVIPAAKPVNAAAASLRQSAAVGEQYLNDLLTGGLLDVPGVRVPDMDYDINPGKRWGRSSKRAFIFLFALLVLGTGAGVTWYYWSEQKKAEELALHRKTSNDSIGTASAEGLEKSMTELGKALELDPSSTLTFAEVAQTASLQHLLYAPALPDVAAITKAINAAAQDITKPEQEGYRELVIARAALALSNLGQDANPAETLVRTRKDLETWLGNGHDGDRWARWLLARVDLAQGQRSKALSGFRAAAGAKGEAERLIPAMVDEADLLVDDGSITDGLALYDEALAIAKDHPLALMGKALAQTDSSAAASKAISDLSVPLEKETGARLAAYRHLWLALANYTLEYYVPAKEELDRASSAGITEPRFLARLALAHAIAGDLAGAAKARAAVTWFPPKPDVKPETDPEVALADASLLLASGLPARALDVAKGDTLRAQLLRGQALIDLGKPKDALADLDAAAKAAAGTVEVEILDQEAHALAGTGKDRDAALAALDGLARKKTRLGRHAQGVALLAAGNAKDAKERLEQALADITDEQPNPVSYRTHTALAQLALAADPPDLEYAAKHLDAAATANPGYLPALALNAKLYLRAGKPDEALDNLSRVMNEKDAITTDSLLVLAEALATRTHTDPQTKKDTTEQDKADAKAALQQAKDAGAPPAEVGRIAALIDPGLPAEMGVPAPPPTPGSGAPPPPGHGPKRRGH